MTSSQLLNEIDEQPAALARLLRERRDVVREAAARVRRFDPEWVVIAARGTSDNAARYAQYVLGAHNRLGVGLAVVKLLVEQSAGTLTVDSGEGQGTTFVLTLPRYELEDFLI